MRVNEGTWDRVIRVVIGLGLGYLAYLGLFGTVGMWVFGIVGAVSFITGVTGFCGLYKLLGMSTCPVHA